MRKIILSILLFCSILQINAQGDLDKLLKMANNEYNNLRYAYAIPLYKNYLNKDAKNIEALNNLAKSYQTNNQYDSAIKYFLLAKSNGANIANNLTELYASKGLYNEAIAAITNNSFNPSRYKSFTDVNVFKIDSLDYTLNYLKLNTSFNENAISFLNKAIVFESNRAEKIRSSNEFSWDASSFSRLYTSSDLSFKKTDELPAIIWDEKSYKTALSDLTATTSNDNTTFSKKYDFKNVSFENEGVTFFNNAFNIKYNAGAICFSTDSSTAYFTRNIVNTKKIHQLEIWSASKSNSGWSNFIKLSFNNNEASYAHPAITKDGKRLYFISDQVGGYGGTDIYYAELGENGAWGSPVNAGNIINTVSNELYPTISNDQLFFSSNGHPGLGGLDIYKTMSINGKFTSIQNVGYPINNTSDDMSFYQFGDKGYFVSNRYGSDDIFSFDFKEVFILLSGKVKISDGKIANQIPIGVLDNNGKVILSAKTDANGNFGVYVRPNRVYKIQAIEPNGNKAILDVNSSNYTGNTKSGYNKSVPEILINVPIPEPVIIEQKISFNNLIDSLKAQTNDYEVLHHNFDKVTLEKSHLKGFSKLLRRVTKMKGLKIIVVSAADCKGTDEYNEKLSARRADFISNKIKAVSKTNTFVTFHVGERILAEPCEENADKDKQLKNRYTIVFIHKQ